jgi:hypothetical protein
MFNAREIIEKDLKDGRDYMLIGGRRYRVGDCLLDGGQEVTIKRIIDPVHLADERNRCLHSYMYYDQKWEHCPERNADKKTKDRTYAAVVADRVRIERERFKESTVQELPYQVYENYRRIAFYERVGWNIIEREREPNGKDTKALLKRSDYLAAKGVGLIADMYRAALYKSDENVSSKSDIDRFVSGYLSQSELC